MYNMLSLLTGVVIAVMVAVNGGLSQHYGIFIAAVIIHIVGVLFAFLLCVVLKRKISFKKLPLWLYTGGAIGVLTTVFNNFAFGRISMTSIVALGLFGQTVTSLAIDCLGLFGMEKHPFKKSSLLGLVFSLAGIFVMLDDISALSAVILSFCSGITVVISRTVNAGLSKHSGELQSSFINHLVGLPITVVIALMLERASISSISPNIIIYCGGMLGVITVLLCNLTVPKVAAFSLTLLTFVGQVFTGAAIDVLTESQYSRATFIGGILVASGMALNLLYEYCQNKKALS